MADSYSKWQMTPRFATATQRAIADGDKIEWVRFIASDDIFELTELETFNDTVLKTIRQKQVTTISSVTLSGSTVTITGVFTNKQNPADYNINTLLLVARHKGQEFLAGASIANSKNSAFRMPSASTTEITEFTTRPQITVTTTGVISTTVDPVAAATNERVDSLEKSLVEKIEKTDDETKSLWKKLADYVTKTGNETILGIKIFAETIVGNVTGNAGSATRLQTARRLNVSGDVKGVAQSFNGTTDTTIPVTLNDVQRENTQSPVSSLSNGDVLRVLDGVKTDSKGRVIGTNEKAVRLPPEPINVTGNSGTTDRLKTPRKVGGVRFDGSSDILLPGVDVTGNQNTTGNAASADKLRTGRTINGVKYDGTINIEIEAKPNNDTNLVHRTGNENIGGVKTYTSRTRTTAGLSASVSAANGQKNGNLYPFTIDVPKPIADGGMLLYGQTFVVNPNIMGQTNNNYFLGLQSGGTTTVGSGEAAASMALAMASRNSPDPISDNGGVTEQLILVSDQHVHIGAGYQNGGTSGRWMTFYDNGNLHVPGKVVADVQGNADTATKAVNADKATNADHATNAGNAVTADRLKVPRTINGTPYDGSKNITLDKMPRGFDGDWIQYNSNSNAYGLMLELVVSGNVGVLTIFGNLSRDISDDGDIALFNPPASWPRPRKVTGRGILVDITNEWNFGAFRYTAAGNITMNFNRSAKNKGNYVEGAMTFLIS